VLVTYLAAQRSALSYAVGEWARVWPLSGLIRMMGAYFIRRRPDRPLYRRVLARYVQMATSEGVTQAIFPEGGLSLDGRTGEPKLGLLSYIVAGADLARRDVVFVPVSLNYDRVVEDRVLIAARAAGVRRFRAPVVSIAAFVLRHIWRALLGRFRRFGDAVVCFGAPVSLRALAAETPGDPTAALAGRLMADIARNVPVLSVPLVAAAWGSEAATDRAALVARAGALLARLRDAGAEIALPEGGAPAAVDAALAIFALRRLVHRRGDRLVLGPDQRPLLDFYAASVLQLFDAGAETTVADRRPIPAKRQRAGHKITK
jgi:glycerol-3-phosphate O-acyltransferase